MERLTDYFVHQNLGLIDRTVRFVIGFALLGIPFIVLSRPGGEAEWWHSVSMLVSIYPLMTALLGTDPIYKAMGKRTCEVTGRNQCGSLPYQVDAFVGREPIPENNLEHELSHSRHVKHA